MQNALMVIAPYRFEGTWVFDDETTGLVREPFVAGIPEMIDDLVRAIPNAADGFRLTFSARPFPGAQLELERQMEEADGWWYRDTDSRDGWLCPALYLYFEQAPERIFLRADPSG